MWRGKSRAGVSILWDKMITTDLAQQAPLLDLPVYFCSGKYDYTVSYAEAKAYFEKLKVPIKGFYAFEHSATAPCLKNLKRFSVSRVRIINS
jgi:hypothetical protein